MCSLTTEEKGGVGVIFQRRATVRKLPVVAKCQRSTELEQPVVDDEWMTCIHLLQSSASAESSTELEQPCVGGLTGLLGHFR